MSIKRPYFALVKKTAVIILMLIYGSATMGATIHLHYCMNQLVGSSLWHSDQEKCGKCGMNEDNDGCCKDEHQHFKLKVDHQQAAVEELINLNLTTVADNPFPNFNLHSIKKVPENYAACHAPPDIGKHSLYVLNCTFRI